MFTLLYFANPWKTVAELLLGEKPVMSTLHHNRILTNWKTISPKSYGTSVVHKNNRFSSNCSLDNLHLLPLCLQAKQTNKTQICCILEFLPFSASLYLFLPRSENTSTHNFLTKICVLIASLLTYKPYLNTACKIFALNVFFFLSALALPTVIPQNSSD